MLSPDWLQRKHTFCHITLRDIDVVDLDVERMIADLKRLHIEVATLFAGGYVATYPTNLSFQRVCPGLEGRDLFGEILAAAAAAHIVIIPCIDIGEIPLDIARDQPGLAAVDCEGQPIEKSAVTAQPCSLGPYIRDCAGKILGELVDRYAIQSIKWAGASNNGTPMGCQCPNCKSRYLQDVGQSLPVENFAADPIYTRWRSRIIQEGVDTLKTLSSQHGLTVVGNNVWHLGRKKNDICAIAGSVDVVQIEVQSRFYHWMSDGQSDQIWEHFSAPIESTRYVAGVSKNPPWVVASYFLAWPWRWSGVPAAEQYLYLAQVAANGGSPGINFTTGAPHQHYDPRGKEALEKLFSFFTAHDEIFQGDRSAARLALIYDHDTALLDIDRNQKTYLAELNGIQEVLNRCHLPFDLISADRPDDLDPARHLACIIPDASALAEEKAEFYLNLETSHGIGCVWTGAPGSLKEKSPSWWPRIGTSAVGAPRLFLELDEAAPPQSYASLTTPDHPLCQSIAASVLAMADYYWPVEPVERAETPLTRLPTFRLFPEGQAYPHSETCAAITRADALAITLGQQIFLPFRAGLLAEKICHPDHDQLIINALHIASAGKLAPLINGKPGLRLSQRKLADGREALHIINTTGHHRFLNEFTPLHDVRVRVPKQTLHLIRSRDGARLPVEEVSGQQTVLIPVIESYDVFILEN